MDIHVERLTRILIRCWNCLLCTQHAQDQLLLLSLYTCACTRLTSETTIAQALALRRATIPMSYMVDVGLICNRMVYTVVFGINSTHNAVRKCEIVLGFASHYFTLPDCIACTINNPKYHSRPSYYIYLLLLYFTYVS